VTVATQVTRAFRPSLWLRVQVFMSGTATRADP